MGSELRSEFTPYDVETLIESVGDWESSGLVEYHILNMIKNVPMPPTDHEAYEPVKEIKEFYKSKEKEIKNKRDIRQEVAVFLKAKLMMVRKEFAIIKAFDMAEKGIIDSSAPKEAGDNIVPENNNEEYKQRLLYAEQFISECGINDFYKKFLNEKQNPSCQLE